MTDAFISHAPDDIEWVRWVAERLRQEALTVSYEESLRSPGELKVDVIENAIQNAAHGILVFSKAALRDRWVRETYATLIRRSVENGQRLIPVVIEAVTLPDFARNRFSIDLSGADGPDRDSRLEELIRALRGQPPIPAAPPDDETRPDRPRHRRRVIIAAVAAGIAVVVVAVTVAVLGPFDWRDPDVVDGDRAKPSNATQPAVVGDVRKADPCSMLDAKVLARFGDTRIDTNYGEFDRCDVLVSKKDSGHAVAHVNLNFVSKLIGPGSVRRTQEGHVAVGEPQSRAKECAQNLLLADGNQVLIRAKQLESPAPDPCALAQVATDHAVTVLNRGPVPERPVPFPANSLANIDACALLDDAALSVIPGISAHDPERDFANWGCEWRSTTANAGVDLEFSQDDDLTDNGQPTRLGGRRSYVAPEDRTCVVHMEHRSYTDAVGEPTIEVVMVTVDGPQPNKALCDTAEALATAVAKKLPKP
ncbi:hypothetical protein Aple_085680 [Acrocarpospora pleiomorpha]|uniref:TIR domain-containing protein n=1 Tax=Acrocarpospora pleiomorpha TaxID=90975 RepID=A0A5M3Y0G2_9ACTN|nr:TIR domain-containing protein [Acrocarpospora pleiomorpha]GES25669.1 hypothetical protein Aple_085680 [Acrocarpospora pleiomorpha]